MQEHITSEYFKKLDLRVGLIEKVEDHPNADKLYVLTVNFGEELGQRTIVAGLKDFCAKEKLVYKRAIFITNLEPRIVRGIESQGMILAASSPSKSEVCFLKPDLEDIEEGSKVS